MYPEFFSQKTIFRFPCICLVKGEMCTVKLNLLTRNYCISRTWQLRQPKYVCINWIFMYRRN